MCGIIPKFLVKLYYVIVIKVRYSWTMRKKRKKEKKIKSLLKQLFEELEISNSIKEKIIGSYLTLINKILGERIIHYSLKMRKLNFDLEQAKSRQKA